jgi:hypothetical protein
MNTLPQVAVTRVEANQGWLITCTQCPNYRTLVRPRETADKFAAVHRGTHARPDPQDAA